MSFVSVNEASKLINKSVKTIYRHIDNGKLSCSLDENGNKIIDTSELIRVYGNISIPSENVNIGKMSLTENKDDKRIIEILENENKALKQLLSSKEDHISSLKQAMTLLEYKQEETKKKSFLKRLFNGN